ncbi:MAG: DUF1254 domain-containing protein [Pseudomonadales bacterium]|nr:DUF1254 domain-containing protein [Pseudomonadales bacterium]
MALSQRFVNEKNTIMKKSLIIVLAVLLIIGAIAFQALTQVKRISSAYLYGYPLLLMDKTRAAMLDAGANSNQLLHSQAFPDHTFRNVVRPNNDTLYSIAWLDLSTEALVLTVPDTGGRYYVMPLMDAWTNVFASIGKRSTGTGAGSYLITGPDWQGTVPTGLSAIAAPTNMVWMIGRIQTNGRKDIPAVTDLQQEFSLTPLHQWQAGARSVGIVNTLARDGGRVDPNEELALLDAESFLAKLAQLMSEQYPLVQDEAMLEQLAAIGVTPGVAIDKSKLGVIGSLLGDFAIDITRQQVLKRVTEQRSLENGWAVHRQGIGTYGREYGARAAVAMVGLGALPAEEASYPSTNVDANLQPLSGAYRYRLHFAAGETPPVDAFWSVTMYDEQGFLIENPIDRYAIGDRDELQYNRDGSLDINIQHDQQEEGPSNWLPAPLGSFTLTMRIYVPKSAFLDGSWVLPAVRRLD